MAAGGGATSNVSGVVGGIGGSGVVIVRYKIGSSQQGKQKQLVV